MDRLRTLAGLDPPPPEPAADLVYTCDICQREFSNLHNYTPHYRACQMLRKGEMGHQSREGLKQPASFGAANSDKVLNDLLNRTAAAAGVSSFSINFGDQYGASQQSFDQGIRNTRNPVSSTTYMSNVPSFFDSVDPAFANNFTSNAFAEKKRAEKEKAERKKAALEEARRAEMERKVEEERRRNAFDYERHEAEFEAVSSGTGPLKSSDIPWLPRNAPLSVFGNDALSLDSLKIRLRAAAIRWHPDKFKAKFGNRVREAEAKEILERVLETSQNINDLRATL